MTSQKRAKKIMSWIDSYKHRLGRHTLIEDIAAQIDEVVYDKMKETAIYQIGYIEGFRDAQEKAIKIAKEIEKIYHKSFPNTVYPGVADPIRQMEIEK